LLNIILPLFAALSYGALNSDDFFQEMSEANVLTKVAVYAYTLSVITASIPVYGILLKNNLYISEVCGRKASAFLGVILPWAIGWLFNSGIIFASLLNWVSLILGLFPAFLFPMILYYLAQRNHVRNHGEPATIVGALPGCMLPYWRPLVLIIFLTVAVPAAFQIAYDFIELVVFGNNVLN